MVQSKCIFTIGVGGGRKDNSVLRTSHTKSVTSEWHYHLLFRNYIMELDISLVLQMRFKAVCHFSGSPLPPFPPKRDLCSNQDEMMHPCYTMAKIQTLHLKAWDGISALVVISGVWTSKLMNSVPQFPHSAKFW